MSTLPLSTVPISALRFLPTAALATCLLSACVVPSPYAPRNSASSPTQSIPESGVQTQAITTPDSAGAAQPLPAPVARPRGLSAATKALVAQAQTQLNAGNDALAAATIERALRIEPDSPLLWIELAKVRQNEGNASQAENLARKALAMSSGDARVQASAWRIIAESYRARGRNPEARDADARAAALGG